METNAVQYYKPWELTTDQEDEIQRQVDEAQAVIDDELDNFERRHDQEQHEDRRSSIPVQQEPAEAEPSKMDIEPEEQDQAEAAQQPQVEDQDQEQETEMEGAEATAQEDEPAVAVDSQPNDSPATSATAVNEPDAEQDARDTMEDDHGETVVEAEEDTVIY